MYLPEKFEVTDSDEIFAFIDANAFGQLISVQDERPFATHLPFDVSDDRRQLHCHMARHNPQWQHLGEQQVLVTFLGAHDYVSPSWYQNAGVPTWNYQAVHVYGHCRVIADDDAALAGIVDKLTQRYESRFESPWQPKYRDAMLKSIIGVEIEITEIQAKYKLSQNRPAADRPGVIENLERLGSHDLAGEMRRILF